VFGCADPGNTPVPSLDSVKRKIARDKLKVMVEAARALRG
jgi:methionine synthase II (cobalamin-independent)